MGVAAINTAKNQGLEKAVILNSNNIQQVAEILKEEGDFNSIFYSDTITESEVRFRS